jgi:transcriptional regulator with XRE-family HTH domain
MLGNQIRQARIARNLSLNDVAGRAEISVATLSRVERDKQGLDLGLFLTLCKVLNTSPQELLADAGEAGDVDPLVVKIAGLEHRERVQLWRDLAASRRETGRRIHMRVKKMAEEFEELLAQFEFIRAEIEAVRSRVRRR